MDKSKRKNSQQSPLFTAVSTIKNNLSTRPNEKEKATEVSPDMSELYKEKEKFNEINPMWEKKKKGGIHRGGNHRRGHKSTRRSKRHKTHHRTRKHQRR